MTEKKDNYGCLTESMSKFLKISEKKREKTYGKNVVSKTYERIRKNIGASFLDVQFAFACLPEKQRMKIDLVTSYNNLLTFVTESKLAGNIADVPIRTAITQLVAIRNNIKNKQLKDYSDNEFDRFIKLLKLIESKSPDYDTLGTPTDNSQKQLSFTSN